jgi:hypothetical protein
MSLNIELSDIIAILAFGLALYSTVKTHKFNQRQQHLIDTQDELSKLLLRKEKDEALDKYSADISANFVRLGSNNLRLKVFNKGKQTARNIRIEFPDGNDMIIKSDVGNKFPLETLEQHQSVELLASSSFGSPNKITIKMIWDDNLKKDNSKLLTITT